MEKQFEQIPVPLLQWYEEHRRILPWRSEPTAYRVWLSEIMLQQTRVAAVLPYFNRFVEQFPTVTDLANAPLDTVLKLWQGLGYYSRARSLHRTAAIIRDEYGGVFPADYEKILALPGIGDYTASAICSIAFDMPTPVVDGNVLRVVTRLNGDERDILKNATKRDIKEQLEAIIPVHAASAFNQAMMELGALVCLPNGAPACEACPLGFCCHAHLTDTVARYPYKTAKKPRRLEERMVYIVVYDGCVALRRRAETGLLAGLYELPNELDEPDWQIAGERELQNLRAKHIFTHIEWHMHCVVIHAQEQTLPQGWLWSNWEELTRHYAIANAFSKFMPLVKQLIGSE